MSKFCSKCGIELQDEDFLCPQCGAIWGDRIYQVPARAASSPRAFDEHDDVEVEVPAVQAEKTPRKPRKNRFLRWLLPLMAVLIGLILIFVLADSDISKKPEDSDQPTTTTAPEQDTPIVIPDGFIKYTVQFVDMNGNPIKGVKIEDPTQISSYKQSGADGKCSFNIAGSGTPYVWIVAVPEGFSEELNRVKIFFEEGETTLTIVIPFKEIVYTDPDSQDIEIDIY